MYLQLLAFSWNPRFPRIIPSLGKHLEVDKLSQLSVDHIHHLQMEALSDIYSRLISLNFVNSNLNVAYGWKLLFAPGSKSFKNVSRFCRFCIPSFQLYSNFSFNFIDTSRYLIQTYLSNLTLKRKYLFEFTFSRQNN